MTLTYTERDNGDDRTTAKSCPFCDDPLVGVGPNGGDKSLARHIRDECGVVR